MGVKVTRAAYDYCTYLTRKTRTNFYYGMAGLDADQRNAMSAIYAYCRRCDDIVDEEDAVNRKGAVLDAWERDLDLCFDSRPVGPIYIALHDAIERFSVPHDALRDVLIGCRMDLFNTRYQTYDELEEYCNKVAGAVGLAILPVFGYSDEKAKHHIEDMGRALQLTNIMRDVKEDAERGRIYLPGEQLEEHHIPESEIFEGKCSESFRDLMKNLGEKAQNFYESGYKVLDYLPRRSRLAPRLFMGIYGRILDRIRDVNYNVFDNDPRLGKFQKLRIAAWLYVRNYFP
jgi:phytoene synthase